MNNTTEIIWATLNPPNISEYNLLRLLDLAAPSLILAQGLGRWGNFFNSEAHGFATTYTKLQELLVPEFIIKGMNIGGVYYLPTFYFEFIWCFPNSKYF